MAKITVEKLIMIHAMLQYNPPKKQTDIARAIGCDDTTVSRYCNAIYKYTNGDAIPDNKRIDTCVFTEWCNHPINKDLYEKYGEPKYVADNKPDNDQEEKKTVNNNKQQICSELSKINETLDMIQRAIVSLVDAWKGSVS